MWHGSSLPESTLVRFPTFFHIDFAPNLFSALIKFVNQKSEVSNQCGIEPRPLKETMKVFALILASACARSTQPRETTETPPSSETPHDPEAMAFCHRACQGQENGYPGTGYCTDGTYPHYKDCDAYVVCWDAGTYSNVEHFKR